MMGPVRGAGRRARAFSLVEMLVCIAIMAVLATAGLAAYSAALGRGPVMKEIAAAKTLVQAYQLNAAENNGRYLPSFDPYATNVLDENGKAITMQAIRERYTYRLAPYFDYQLRGTILVNGNERQIRDKMASMYSYGVSQFPALGINRYMVGGRVLTAKGDVEMASDCVTRQSEGDSSLIAFISAGTDGIDGYEYVRPPILGAIKWSGAPWTKDSHPSDYQNVDFRFEGKAVCAFLGGSVRLCGVEELRDMRLWSHNAAQQNDPNYVPGL